MQDRKNNCGLIILLTFFVGILVGIFSSPDSGSNNRSKLRYRMDNLLGGFKFSMERFLKYIKSLNLGQDKEAEIIVKETIDKADRIMNEI